MSYQNKKITPSGVIFLFARGQGIEPRLTGPKPVVLPLDDPRIIRPFYKYKRYIGIIGLFGA
jgi:hypothetical protein